MNESNVSILLDGRDFFEIHHMDICPREDQITFLSMVYRCARELEEEAFGCRDVSVYALLDDHHSIDHIMFQQARRKNSEQPLIHCRNISITGLRQELPLPKAKELMRVELDVQNLNDVVLLTTNENMRYIAQSYGVYCIEPGPGKDLDEIDEEIFCRFSQNREDFFHIPSL